MDDDKKMSRSDYEDYLSLALSSANHEFVSDAIKERYETIYHQESREN